MKKLLPLLILFLMLLASCSLDSFMDAMSGNSFAGNNNANADYVSSAVDSMRVSSVKEDAWNNNFLDLSEVDGFGSIVDALKESGLDTSKIEIDQEYVSIINKGLLTPQEDPTNLYNSLSGALGSTSGIASLSDQLAESAPGDQSNAAKGSIALVLNLIKQIPGKDDTLDKSISDMLDDLTIELDSKVKPGETLSKAEVLQVQIITNTVVAIANAADQLVPGEDGEIDFGTPEDQPHVWSAIDGLTLLSSLQNNLDSDVSMIDIPDVSDIISSALGTGSSSEEGATV